MLELEAVCIYRCVYISIYVYIKRTGFIVDLHFSIGCVQSVC